MCETLGTDWETTARQHITLKLEAWKRLEQLEELSLYLIKASNVKNHLPDEIVSKSFKLGMRQGFMEAANLLFKILDGEQS